MMNVKHPSLLIDLGHVGENGLPLNPAPGFQHELELCRKWGFKLNSTDNRVLLVFDQDQLVSYWIQKETPAIAWDWLRVNGFFSIGSTNAEALELARSGAPGGTLIYSEEQTAGRGRNGHVWQTTPGAGLCFSVILRPSQPLNSWPLLTHVASIALAETLKELATAKIIPHPLDVDIKWPNDVLLSGKKCAGILLETCIDDKKQAAIIGVGINVHKGSVPEELKGEAISIDEAAESFAPRRQLLVKFLHNLQLAYILFEQGRPEELLEKWKSLSSMWNGAPIWIIEGESRRSAVTCGLDETGALLARGPDGCVETIIAGDVRLQKA